MNCKISIYLAYAMSIYIAASIYYLIITYNLGTPFKTSLTPNQKIIKEKAVKKRKTIFYQGVFLSTIFLLIIKPFEKCN